MEHADLVPRYLKGRGVEIGACDTPIPGIKPVYLDRFPEYAGAITLADYRGDAAEVPYHDHSLDYVASSHLLEHTANPFAALAEWFRVLRHGGIVYMVVPDRRYTFDHTRPLTPVAHMLEDYENGTTPCDGTHIDDFVNGLDWTRFMPAATPEERERTRADMEFRFRYSVGAGLELNIHFHTFEPTNVRELIALGNARRIWPGQLEVLELQESFPASCPNGILLVARVQKHWPARLRALVSRKGLRADARAFERLEAPTASQAQESAG